MLEFKAARKANKKTNWAVINGHYFVYVDDKLVSV